MRQDVEYGKLRTLVEDSVVRINHLPQKGSHLIVSFASIGKGWHLMPPDEFVGTISKMPNCSGLFISDMTRSWMNSSVLRNTVERVVNEVIAEFEIEKVTTLGLSMGAFSALVAPRLFPVDTAIALSPQFSVSREIVPSETRWRHWTKNIQDFHFPSVLPISPMGRVVICHGLVDDYEQMKLFPQQDNVDHFVFPNARHAEIGKLIKKGGKLSPFITAASAHKKRSVAQILRGLGGSWRMRYEVSAHGDAAV
ncbi:hypothetical protein [Shimia sagamensis]|uniref:Alpha/beta hydrolase family protein n=1 Tax=Shimia sagamensis TaxID=1566352 RepID=A0ABY1PM95_9RHOB|nr:hypothetical protein [Shimia sagamensis]SMP35714.1 hypothetical protein SAMN06265373_1125 [Shimia sagamensis]